MRYALMDPTGNVTILVEDPVPPASQPAVAARIAAREPAGEQVGFLTPGTDASIALRMAGGEFCGNAAMSAAALYAGDHGIGQGLVTVRVSGASDPVTVAVTTLEAGRWRGEVTMPPPLSAELTELPGAGPLPVVRFRGISHVILEAAPERDRAEDLVRCWCRHLGADALGLMFLDRAAGTMTPLVYVPEAGTLCWENSCASGTTAAAAWLARETGGPLHVSLRQPGGTLEASVSPEGGILLLGTVSLRKRGAAAIPY